MFTIITFGVYYRNYIFTGYSDLYPNENNRLNEPYLSGLRKYS